MKLEDINIDASWLARLGLEPVAAQRVFSRCDYWRRGGDEDIAFLYRSDTLTLISCGRETEIEFEQLQLESLHDYVNARQDLALEVYIDDVDYYLADPEPLAEPNLEVSEITLASQQAELLQFINSSSEAEVEKADFSLDSDYFYTVYENGEMAGVVASYCGVEPFESLSILVKQQFRGSGIGKALLTHLVKQVAQRNRIVRYRTNVENIDSIRLAESIGFRPHSRIQLLAYS